MRTLGVMGKRMRHLMHLLAGCLLIAWSPAFSQQPDQEIVKAVKDFVAAFNAHDSGAMSKFVTDDVQWLSVNEDSIAVETNGKTALVSAMTEYFQSCPTCLSHLMETIATHERVSTIEVASWKSKDGPQTQRAIAVYEFSGSLIKRVYYFPAEKAG